MFRFGTGARATSEQPSNESRSNRSAGRVPASPPTRCWASASVVADSGTAQRGAFTGTVPAFASVSSEVASSRAVPIMVATDTLNGAIRRVPAMGTSQT